MVIERMREFATALSKVMLPDTLFARELRAACNFSGARVLENEQ